MPEYAKIKREMFRTSMPETLKKSFIVLVQNHNLLGQSDKDFICDNIHHYESIDEVSRKDVLDVLDGMEMFVVKK